MVHTRHQYNSENMEDFSQSMPLCYNEQHRKDHSNSENRNLNKLLTEEKMKNQNVDSGIGSTPKIPAIKRSKSYNDLRGNPRRLLFNITQEDKVTEEDPPPTLQRMI